MFYCNTGFCLHITIMILTTVFSCALHYYKTSSNPIATCKYTKYEYITLKNSKNNIEELVIQCVYQYHKLDLEVERSKS
jgi:hypothetical protein